MTIGTRLKQWRLYNNLNQDDASSLLGVPFSTYQKYEMSVSKPGSEAMEAFSRAGIDVNWLLTGEGEMLRADRSTPALSMPGALDMNRLRFMNRLRLAVEAVEETLRIFGGEMTPVKKGEAVVQVYVMLEEEEVGKTQAHTDNMLEDIVISLSKEISPKKPIE
ncbi:MAG: helix-turn-helix transcriptional regulator [Methylovulum sp.]|nr:helix-turn-helix transcriptional regulator [Methylovulum sp.]